MFGNIVSKMLFQTHNQYIPFHIHIRLSSKSERERKRIREKKREFYALAIRVHTRESKLSPFIGQPGKGGRAGSCGEAEGLYVKRAGEGRGWQRRTVVFHSHYRNVLPCALVAPRNKSSVTVTMVVRG